MFNRLISFQAPTFSIEEQRISFKVEKSLVGVPNLAEIVIYNLDGNHRDQIEQKGLEISLDAGYEDEGLFSLFRGQTTNVIHEYVKPDWQTKIFSSDSENAINESSINKSLQAGMTSEQVFNELVDKMQGVTKGITKGLSTCLTGKQSLLRKLILAGDIKKFLNQLADD